MPDFASQSYWDDRFSKNSSPFDWLVPAQALCQVTTDMIDPETVRMSQILHIGCGTSDALALRTLVESPEQIHNVDYSEAAVDAGAKREQEDISQNQNPLGKESGDGEGGGSKHDSVRQPLPRHMNWSCMDLLALHSTLGLLHQRNSEGRLYNIILDKSTSDSIACGQDQHLTLPYPLSINGWTRRIVGCGTHQPGDVHPLHVLAVHLAALTKPRTGKWICISYSEDRFPFVPPFPATISNGLLSDDVIKAGFPHPSQLWRLETKEKIDLEEAKEETLAERKKRLSAGVVQRPRVSHWLYVLRRTDAIVTD
ncbi:Hypothetical predicted protein [Lecanosticta acicola]|uniref:Methyltransferase domain-containing protein n=1 Tax=Lecanosticta acicola TaxID=111012 RepID=A0AAI8Z456_9PEZI|nr:Hypothetical predicted protein [Lecanosticta acicola]